ncbi:hypothetical protein SAMN05443662_1640 [Sulfurivirga caldicuralii]|uniref:Lipid A deacylase LpxR family protein n=1 Tax=Sulfurivirga caldicuralii TaxID=364032 RepID=A0A1N6HBQ4_9GAMM|nr:lipid A-modifier LpxR family protein [Sulfurivirga caldicuralii]SIO17127.1 hypothetical protein SAMN05443662_1640 [Sulfurivirga caldicuralii]
MTSICKALLLLLLTAVQAAHAQQLYLATENDLLAGRDGHYTGGLDVGWHAGACRWLDRDWVQVFQLKGLVFTPLNTQTVPPPDDDLSYAGVLVLNGVLFQQQHGRLNMLGVQLGWLGPSTRMGEIQNQIHRWVGNDVLRGWHYQLKDQPLLGVMAGQGRMLWHDATLPLSLQAGMGAEAGTLLNRGWASLLLRMGPQALHVRLYDQMVGTSASDALEPLSTGWQADLGVQLNWLPHLLLIEEGGVALRPRSWQWKGLLRIAYGWSHWQVAWVGQIAQFPAANRDELDSWGGFVLRRQL